LIQRITERERAHRAIRTATSVEAFEAIVASTLSSLGSVGYENATNERGERLIWLDHAVVAPPLSSRRLRFGLVAVRQQIRDAADRARLGIGRTTYCEGDAC
jgi:hypothetical protein